MTGRAVQSPPGTTEGLLRSPWQWHPGTCTQRLLTVLSDSTDVSVRRASEHEAADVFSLVEEYYEAVSVVVRDTRDAIRATYLNNPGSGVWLAYDGTAAAGCILYHPLPHMGAAGEVKRLYVRPFFRHHGIATALLRALEAFAVARGDEWLYLDTNDSLHDAIQFYLWNGYVPCGRYNDNPQATIFMRKRLQ